MTPLGTTLSVLGVLFVAAFTRSAIGFGDMVVAMPLLTLLIGLRTASPLAALAAFTMTSTILVGSWRQVDLKAAWRLILSALIGIPVGLLLLTRVPEGIAEGVLGVVLIAFGLYNLVGPRLPMLANERWAYPFGFAGGVLGGAYNTNGPPVVVYGALRHWPPGHFRATLQGYFLPTGLAIVVGHGLGGLWTAQVWRLYAFCLPLVLGAVALGGVVNRRMTGKQYDTLVYGFTIVMGVLLLV